MAPPRAQTVLGSPLARELSQGEALLGGPLRNCARGGLCPSSAKPTPYVRCAKLADNPEPRSLRAVR